MRIKTAKDILANDLSSVYHIAKLVRVAIKVTETVTLVEV